jgi:hypothetical protein
MGLCFGPRQNGTIQEDRGGEDAHGDRAPITPSLKRWLLSSVQPVNLCHAQSLMRRSLFLLETVIHAGQSAASGSLKVIPGDRSLAIAGIEISARDRKIMTKDRESMTRDRWLVLAIVRIEIIRIEINRNDQEGASEIIAGDRCLERITRNRR